ncbi:MAG: hypothetical protein ACKO34_02600 [Vampirovibrionales bacterium]
MLASFPPTGSLISPLSAFYPGRTMTDYWLFHNPVYEAQWGMDPLAGNYTTNPELNQVIQGLAAFEPYGLVPQTLTMAQGNPASLNQWDVNSLVDSPLNYRQPPTPTRVTRPFLGNLTQSYLSTLLSPNISQFPPNLNNTAVLPTLTPVPTVLNMLPPLPEAQITGWNTFKL